MEGELDSFCLQTTTAEQLLEFFRQVGSVKFVRMAGDETQPTRFAFVEFSEQDSVARALTFNGVMFGDRPLKSVFNSEVKPALYDGLALGKVGCVFQDQSLQQCYRQTSRDDAAGCCQRAGERDEEGERSPVHDRRCHRARYRV